MPEIHAKHCTTDSKFFPHQPGYDSPRRSFLLYASVTIHTSPYMSAGCLKQRCVWAGMVNTQFGHHNSLEKLQDFLALIS